MISGNFSYSYESCDKQTEFCVSLGAMDGLAVIVVTPNNFTVQDNGDYFGPVLGSYLTPTFTVNQDLSATKCLKGEFSGSGPASFDVEVRLNGVTIFSQNIATPVFEEIDGTVADVYLSDSYSSSGPLLPPSQASNTPQKVKIEGTLIIDENYSFSQNSTGHSEIVMGPDAKIVVEPGVTFSILGNSLTGVKSQVYGCGELWDRIEIKESAQVAIRSVKVEDGDMALYIDNNDQVNATFVNLFASEFLNNRISVFAEDNGLSKNEIDLFVRGNTFSRDENSYSSYSIGLKLSDLKYTEVYTAYTGAGPVFKCAFNGLQMGIDAANSDLAIYEVDFNKISGYGVSVIDNSELVLKNSEFSQPEFEMKAHTGVFASNSDIEVKYYNFYSNTGIRNHGFFNGLLDIGYNEINASRLGIGILNTELAFGDIHHNPVIRKHGFLNGYAIRMANCGEFGDNFNVNNNELIEMVGGVNCINILNSSNILLKENGPIQNSATNKNTVVFSGGSYNHIDCNPISGGNAGIYLSSSYAARIGCNTLTGSQNGLQIFGTCDDTKIRGNDFLADDYDLVYGLSSSNGFALTGRQPELNIDEFHGNIFNGLPSTGINAIHYDPIASNTEDSRYLVANDILDPSTNYIPEAQAAGNWVEPAFDQFGTFSCPQQGCYIPGLVGAGGSSLDQKIKDGALSVGPYSNAVNWTAQRHLYERLNELDSIPPIFDNFIQANATSSIGQFYDIKMDLKSVIEFSENDKLALQAYYQQKNILQDSLLSIRSTWNDAGIPPAQWPLDELQNVYAQIYPISEAIATIYKLRKQAILSELPSLVNENSSVPVSTTYELNERRVNEIYFNLLQSEEGLINDAEIAQLEAISYQCPLSGGDAVYRSRALLAMTDSIYIFDDDQLCTLSPLGLVDNKGESLERKQSTGIKVFPNPTNSILHIQWSELIENGTLTLYDLNGRELVRRAIQEQSSISIEVSNLPVGMYQGIVSSNEHQQYFFKAVIQE